MTKYQFIEAGKERHPVSWSCRVVEVSRAAFYKSKKKSQHSQDDDRLSRLLCAQQKRHRGYGARGHVAELASKGIPCSRRRARRLMKWKNLHSSHPRSFVVTTIQGVPTKIPDLVKRHFFAAYRNRVWVADITYVETKQGFVYLALITDVFSRRIVGWAVADHLHFELAELALQRALRLRKPDPGLIIHTDRGTQYTCNNYLTMLRLRKNQTLQSAGATGVCWDNALAESSNGTVKKEAIHITTFKTKIEVEPAVRRYIRYFNLARRHSSLGYLTPQEFEDAHAMFGKVAS
jgi:transposase InsO family protein